MLEARRSTTEGTPSAVAFRAGDPHKIPIDSNGNLSTKTEGTDAWTYEWNARNELTRVVKNGVERVRVSYDPLGRRVARVSDGSTTSFTYDLTSTLRQVSGSAVLKYIAGPAIDEPLAVENALQLRTSTPTRSEAL